VPPERIGGTRGDSLTYSNQEQGTNDLISWSLRPWVRRWENAFFQILPQRRYVKFDVDDLVRVDQSQRYANYKTARDTGWITNDEIRYDEDRQPLPQHVGEEPLPNEILQALARGGAGVPKSWGPLLDISGRAEGETPLSAGRPGAKPPAVPPAGGTPPVPPAENDQAVRYSLEEIARDAFGPLAGKREYLDLVTASAKDAGYAVESVRAEQFSKEQAQWIAADSLRRPRPIEYFGLNGNGREAARHG
jgi:hypothetical protein